MDDRERGDVGEDEEGCKEEGVLERSSHELLCLVRTLENHAEDEEGEDCRRCDEEPLPALEVPGEVGEGEAEGEAAHDEDHAEEGDGEEPEERDEEDGKDGIDAHGKREQKEEDGAIDEAVLCCPLLVQLPEGDADPADLFRRPAFPLQIGLHETLQENGGI